MQKNYFTIRQAEYVIALFIIGSSIVIGANPISHQDAWISFLLAMAVSVPFLLIYSRIIKLFPETCIFDVATQVFGKVIGTIITALMTWYALHLGALVIRNFTEFIKIVAMNETPDLPIAVMLLLVSVYVAKSSMSTFGKWGLIALPILIIMVIITVFMAVRNFDFTNFLPVMGHPFKKIWTASLQLTTFPFLETVVFLCLSSSVKSKDSPYRIFMVSMLIGGGLLLLILLRNIAILGPEVLEAEMYPSYTATRIISIGDFLSRIEGVVSVNFVLSGITKIVVCLHSSTRGITKLLKIQQPETFVVPTSALMFAVAGLAYTDHLGASMFLETYQYYALPFQVLIPVIVWIGCEIKVRKQKKQQSRSGTEFVAPNGIYEG